MEQSTRPADAVPDRAVGGENAGFSAGADAGGGAGVGAVLGVRPAPPLDAEGRAALAAMPGRVGIKNLEQFVSSLRDVADFDASDEDLIEAGAVDVSEVRYPSYDGEPRTLLVCRTVTPETDPQPALYFAHGGGMVTGTPRTGLVEMLRMARDLHAVVVSVDYRLAPEHRDPAPLEDTYAGLRATFARASDLGIDADRVAMVGSSAGGALVAGSALLARDRHGPRALGAMLLNPMLDDRNDSMSVHQMVGVDQWDRDANHFGWQALLGERAGGAVSHYTAPARAEDLSRLPATYLDVGSAETLRDETVRYAQGIWAAGGDAELHVWPGGYHGYEFVAPHSRLAQETWDTRVRWLRRTLAE